MAEKITLDIALLQGVFGDLTRLQQQLGGITGGVAAVDRACTAATGRVAQGFNGASSAVHGTESAVDIAMRNMVADIMAPAAKTKELEDRLAGLGKRVSTSKSVGEIVALKREISGVQRELDKVSGSGMEQRVSGPASRLRGLFAGIAGPIAGAFAVGGVATFGRSVIDAAAAQQSYNTSLEVMLQSKGKADALAAQVKGFAATTPFELPQVQAASGQLLALGFAQEKVIPTMTTLGNVASALNQPIGDIAYLYGTARTQGRLFTNDLNQFTSRGIPIVAELAKVMGTTEANVKALTEKGEVGFDQLEKAMNNLGGAGGRFDGLMERQSKTIGGVMSNLSDAWGQFKADLGMSMADSIMGGINLLGGAIAGLRTAFAWMQDNGPLIRTVLLGVAGAAAFYGTVLLITNAELIFNNGLQLIANVRMAASTVATNIATAAMIARNVAMGAFNIILGIASGAITVTTVAQWALNAALNANPIGLVIAAIAALVAGVVWCWNNLEGFRAFLFGLWESVKVVFGGIWEVVKVAFSGIVEAAQGVGKVLKGVWDGNFDMIAEGVKQFAGGIADNITAPFRATAEAVKQAQGMGEKMGAAYAEGDKKGRASFQADVAAEAAEAAKSNMPAISAEASAAQQAAAAVFGAPTTTDALQAAPGGDVGAASLVGGDKASHKKTKEGGGGVTVGGGQGGGDRNIAMNITMNMAFPIGQNADMDVRTAAERIAAMLTQKLNDAQFALG